MGLLHHILVKDRQHASTIGSLVDLTSAVIHHRRHQAWNAQYWATELTTVGFRRPLVSQTAMKSWEIGTPTCLITKSHQQLQGCPMRTLRCENRTINGTTHRFLATRGFRCLHELSARIVSCNPNPRSAEHHRSIQTVRHPDPGQEERFELKFSESSTFDLNEDGEYLVRGLDTCPHLESGTCWWFAPRSGALEDRPVTSMPSVSRKAHVSNGTLRKRRTDQGGEISLCRCFIQRTAVERWLSKKPGHCSR